MTTKYFNTVLNQLNYDFSRFTLDDFVAHISQQTGCNIFLFPFAAQGAFLGAWVSDDESDNEYIFYEASLSSIHKVHTILHELAHFLLGHQTRTITEAEIMAIAEGRASLPEMTAFRQKTSSKQEQEAETLAASIFTRVLAEADHAATTSTVSSTAKGNLFLSNLRRN